MKRPLEEFDPIEKKKIKAELERALAESSFPNLLGMRIDDLGKGWARASMELVKKVEIEEGKISAGVVTAFADFALSAAIYTLRRTVAFTTVEQDISFLAPLKTGRLTAHARVLKQSPHLSTGEIELLDDKGSLIAKSLATYIALNRTPGSP